MNYSLDLDKEKQELKLAISHKMKEFKKELLQLRLVLYTVIGFYTLSILAFEFFFKGMLIGLVFLCIQWIYLRKIEKTKRKIEFGKQCLSKIPE